MTDNLTHLMKELPQDLDAVLITSDINRRYYTGFPSSAGTVVVTRQESYLIIDSRYFEAAEKAVKSCKVVLQDKLYGQIASLLEKHGAKRIGLEGETVSIASYLQFKEMLADVEIAFDNRVSELVNRHRRVKSEAEIQRIQQAQDITDATFAHMLEFITPGLTEREIALEIDTHNRKLGADGPAFSTIVASGANSSRPHAVPSEKVVERGDFVTMDFGAMAAGYCSDMTRTVAVGCASDKMKDVYETVLKAQLAGIAAIRAGVPCVEVDKVSRDIIDGSPYKGRFGHGLGHSLGLEIHEPPNFNTISKDVAEPGFVMSVEPGIYLPGEFGVRIEDIVAVTGEGCHNFTKSPKDLIVL